MRLLKTKTLIFILSICLINVIQAQRLGKSIEIRTTEAERVFEGEIIEKSSFWNSERTRIFTKNTVLVSRNFKGETATTIDIITHGGTIDGVSHTIPHGISFRIGQEGLFFCKQFDNSGKGEDVFLMLNGMSGVILYDLKTNGIQARDVSKEYNNIWNDIFLRIESTTAYNPEVIGQNGFEELVDIWLEDNLNLFSSSDTIIEFTFQNIQINGGDEVEFDIFVKSNQNGIRFVGSDVFLKYSTSAFGSSVVQNDKLHASKETVIDDPIYSLNVNDFDTDIVKLIVTSSGASSSSNYFPISQVEEKFIHVTIDVENIIALATVSFEDFLMTNQSMFYDEENDEYVPFSKIVVSPPTDMLGGPMILGFSSEDVNNPHHISAGRGEVLTISGMNLGEVKGKVRFRSADSILDEVETSESDIDVWSGNEIQVRVPSADVDLSGHSAASGLIKVELPDGVTEATSGDVLFVDFSVYNFRTNSMVSVPINLADTPEGDGVADSTLTFSLSTNMSNNAPLRDIVNQSLCDWNAQTEIKWTLATSYSNKITAGNNDNVNLIYFGEESEFTGESADLGAYTVLTTSGDQRRIVCNPTGVIQREVDIVFRKGTNLVNANSSLTNGWHYSSINPPSNPGSGQVDFYSLLMHELGHAHLLRHTGSPGNINIMDVPELFNGEVHRIPSSNDIDGGMFLVDRSQAVGNSIFCNSNSAVAVLNEVFCSPTSVETPAEGQSINYFIRNKELVIVFPEELSGDYDLSVFTIDGRKLFSDRFELFSGEDEKITYLSHLTNSNMLVFQLRDLKNNTFFSGRFILTQ